MLELNLHPFTPIETERLLLRQLTPEDAGDIFTLRSNKGVMAFIQRPIAQSIEDAEALIQRIATGFENNDGITWAMTPKGENRVIGTMALWRIIKEHYRAEIGYMLHPDYHGKGFMQEAIIAALNYGFNVMKLHSVEAHVKPDNIPSIKLLERNGFVREAYFREDHYFEGAFYDTAVYSLLNPNR